MRRAPCKIAGSWAGVFIVHLFAEIRSFRNDRPFSATNFKLVAVRILEEKRIVPATVTATDFRTFERLAARVAHQLCEFIHFFPRIGPERDACAVRFMILVPCEPKEFRRLIAAGGIKSMVVSSGFFLNKSKLRQEFSVKLSCRRHVFHS